MTLRTWARAFLTQLGERVDPPTWQDDHDLSPEGAALQRTKPVVFGDVDALGQFLTSLADEGPVIVFLDDGLFEKVKHHGENATIIAERVANLVAGRRTYLTVRGNAATSTTGSGPTLSWHITFATGNDSPVMIMVNGEDPMPGDLLATRAAALSQMAVLRERVEQYTSRPPRGWKPGNPLIEPITMKEALQRTYELKIQRRALLAGAGAGLVGALILEFLVNVLF